jgi:hypothetical protein
LYLLRRQYSVRATPPLIAALLLSACTTAHPSGATTPSSPASSSPTRVVSAPPALVSTARPLRNGVCSARQLVAQYAGGVSPETGEHPAMINVWNVSHVSCQLRGYPQVELRSGSQPLPFRYHRGGEYIQNQRPVVVRLRPGGAAHLLIAKYRCDSGSLAAVTRVAIAPAPRHGWDVAQLPSDDAGPHLDLCKAFTGTTASDPGNTVQVGLFEPGNFHEG